MNPPALVPFGAPFSFTAGGAEVSAAAPEVEDVAVSEVNAVVVDSLEPALLLGVQVGVYRTPETLV